MDGLLEKIKALPDLRKLDDTTMLERLTTEWPHSLKEKMVNGAFGTTTRGLDVLLVFVRYLVVILPSGPDIDTGIRIKDRFACEKNMYVDIDENMTKERFHAKLEKPAKPSTEEDSSTTGPRTRIKAILDALQGNAATGDTSSEAEEGGPGDEAGPTGPSGFEDHEKGYDGH
ncbi:hypothetical protein K4K59_001812 [Colletotrichum sp. SAR11_240]|nr:hypothetical protein K4K59_001812 [Colletotrichum sp. SAR11_240]